MNEQVKDILAHLRGHMGMYDQAAQVLDQKSQNVLSATSFVLAVVGTLQAQHFSVISLIPLGIAVFLYIRMFFLTTRSLGPKEFLYPMNAEWDNLQEYVQMDGKQYVDQLMSDYIEYIENNRRIVEGKADRVAQALWLFFDIVVLLLISAFIGMIC